MQVTALAGTKTATTGLWVRPLELPAGPPNASEITCALASFQSSLPMS